MDIRLRTHGNIQVIDVEGEMDLYNADRLRAVFAKLVERKVKAFVVNLEKVTYIDSSGVGVLITIFSSTKQNRWPLRIAGVQSPVRKVLDLTRLSGYLPIAASVEEAVRGMEGTNQGSVS